MSGRRRAAAEWTVFAVSCLILAVVLALIVIEMVRDEQPAAPVAMVDGPVRRDGDRYLVDVEVLNDGDHAATQVQVIAELTIDGETADADQVIDVLGAGERQGLVFIFADDPATGELEVRVAGFTEP